MPSSKQATLASRRRACPRCDVIRVRVSRLGSRGGLAVFRFRGCAHGGYAALERRRHGGARIDRTHSLADGPAAVGVWGARAGKCPDPDGCAGAFVAPLARLPKPACVRSWQSWQCCFTRVGSGTPGLHCSLPTLGNLALQHQATEGQPCRHPPLTSSPAHTAARARCGRPLGRGPPEA